MDPTPWKINDWNLNLIVWKMIFRISIGWFLGSMSIFRGVWVPDCHGKKQRIVFFGVAPLQIMSHYLHSNLYYVVVSTQFTHMSPVRFPQVTGDNNKSS